MDRQLEKERKLLLCEAAARDSGLTNTGLTNIEEASQEDEKMQIDEPSEDIEMLPMRRQGAGRPLVDEEKSTSRGSTSGLRPSSVSEALCSEMGYLHISQS